MICACDLIHSLTLQRYQTTGTDERGQPTGAWVDETPMRAKVEPLAGRDIEIARQLYHLATLRVRMRFNRLVTLEKRFQFRGRALDIGHITNTDERDIELVILCSEEQ